MLFVLFFPGEEGRRQESMQGASRSTELSPAHDNSKGQLVLLAWIFIFFIKTLVSTFWR